MRLIFYLGKGGVGKTAVSLATAVRSAELGYKTLIVSTDVAHNLADFLGQPVSAQPTEIAPNLWAQEINALVEIQDSWSLTQQDISQTISTESLGNVAAEEVAAFPGMDDIANLMNITREAKANNFERIIVDTAATGSTIRLLTMPDSFRWYADYLQRLADNRLLKVAKPIAGLFIKKPAQIQASFVKMEAEVADLRLILRDPDISSYRVVMQPDKITMRESERLISYLSLFDYPIDSVVMNRTEAEALDGDGCQTAEQQRRAEFLQQFKAQTQPFMTWFAPESTVELTGIAGFSQLATACFAETDPGEIFTRGLAQAVVGMGNGRYHLRIPMPYMSAGDVRLRQKGNELFITMGNFKREIILPASLAQRTAVRAQREDGVLTIIFVSPKTVKVAKTG